MLGVSEKGKIGCRRIVDIDEENVGISDWVSLGCGNVFNSPRSY